MVDFGDFDKMIKISVNVDKSDTQVEFYSNVSYFIHGSLCVNKERNITIKPVVSV